MGNSLIIFGIILTVFGILLNLLAKFNLPLLPGDILIQKENFTFYFPIVSSLLVSILLTLIINIFR